MAILKVQNKEIALETPKTFLASDVSSGASSLTVKNIAGFAINQLLLIEDFGSENAEIVKTHAATSPSGTTITLAANTARSHPAGSTVRVLLYDQVEFSSAATATGSKSVLTTADISADNETTNYIDTAGTAGYYFARFKNTISATFSSYTDAMTVAGWATNTVGYMIQRALSELGISFSEKITAADCYAWLNECLREVQGKQIRWPEFYNFNYALTTLTAGDYQYSLPSDIYDTKSNRSILAVRIGSEGTPLTYLDPVDFEEAQDQLVETTAAEDGSVGETAIDLTNAADFGDSGTVYYYASGTQYSFTYTAKSGNTLTGIPASGTGSITQAFTSGDTLYQNTTFSQPTVFTVREGSLDLYPIPGADEHGKNIYVDYSTVATNVDSDGDTIDYHRYDMLMSYQIGRASCRE